MYAYYVRRLTELQLCKNSAYNISNRFHATLDKISVSEIDKLTLLFQQKQNTQKTLYIKIVVVIYQFLNVTYLLK